MAQEIGQYGIRINTLSPGVSDFSFLDLRNGWLTFILVHPNSDDGCPPGGGT